MPGTPYHAPETKQALNDAMPMYTITCEERILSKIPYSIEISVLLAALEQDLIRASRHTVPAVKTPSEATREAARSLAGTMKRKAEARLFLNALSVFANDSFDFSMMKHKVLYYPGLRVCVCCGRLTPRQLLSVMAEPCCDAVVVFPSKRRIFSSCYIQFTLNRPREEFNLWYQAQMRARRKEKRVAAKLLKVNAGA